MTAYEQERSSREWAKRETTGGRRYTVLYPSGITPYKLDQGIDKIDLIPFYAGKFNPNADEGTLHFEARFRIHKIPMKDGNTQRVVCRERWGEACPVCDFAAEQNYPKGQNPLWPQIRYLFLVNNKPGDENNPLKVLDTVFKNRGFGFGEKLTQAIDSYAELHSDEWFDIAALEKGMTLLVSVADSKFGQVNRIDFLPRAYDYSKKILNRVPCLDDCIQKPDDKETMKLLRTGMSTGGGTQTDVQKKEMEATSVQNGEKTSTSDPKTRTTGPAKKAIDKEGNKLTIGSIVEWRGQECEIKDIDFKGHVTLETEDKVLRSKIDPSVECVMVRTQQQPVVKRQTAKPTRNEPDPDIDPDVTFEND